MIVIFFVEFWECFVLTKYEEDAQRRGFESSQVIFCEGRVMDMGLVLGFARVMTDTKPDLMHRGDISHWPQTLNINSRRLSWSCSCFSGFLK